LKGNIIILSWGSVR